jgi:hypothetical protein
MSAPSGSAPSRSEPSRMQIREVGGRLPQASLVIGVGVGIFAALVLGVPKSALWHNVPVAKDQAWAGHLEAPAQPPAISAQPLTSASYTSGFDKTALAPASPNSAPQPQARDPNTCPADLNCAFRTTQMPPLPPSVQTSPPTTIAQTPASVAAASPAVQPAPPPKRDIFAAITSRLPQPHVLLKPFTFVADTFTGLIRKL